MSTSWLFIHFVGKWNLLLCSIITNHKRHSPGFLWSPTSSVTFTCFPKIILNSAFHEAELSVGGAGGGGGGGRMPTST